MLGSPLPHLRWDWGHLRCGFCRMNVGRACPLCGCSLLLRGVLHAQTLSTQSTALWAYLLLQSDRNRVIVRRLVRAARRTEPRVLCVK